MRFFYLCFVVVILGFTQFADAQTRNLISGVVASSTGSIEVSYRNASGQVIGRSASIGSPIHLNDEIRTGPDASLQILLKDQTVFSMGPNARIVFDEFIYDPSGAEESVLTTTISEGVFKFISGKIANQNPESVALNLPNATASIRGTTLAGEVDSNAGTSNIVLLSGQVSVTSQSTGNSVDIVEPGWGTSISQEGEVNEPFVVPQEMVSGILNDVTFTAQSDENDTGSSASGDQANNNQNTDPNTNNPNDSGQGSSDPAAVEQVLGYVAETLLTPTSTNLSIGAIAQYIQEEGLAERLGIDPNDLETARKININIEAELLNHLLRGAVPLWLSVSNDGGGSYSIVNPPPQENAYQYALYTGSYQGLVSDTYSGSIIFTQEGLALGAGGIEIEVLGDGNNAQGTPTQFTSNATASGTVDYTVILNYDTTAITGSLAVNDLVIDSETYADYSGNISVANLGGFAQATQIPIHQSGNIAGGNSGVAEASLRGEFGSIALGGNALDGTIGGFTVEVERTSAPQYAEVAAINPLLREFVTIDGEKVIFNTGTWTAGSGGTFTSSGNSVTWDLDAEVPVNSGGHVADVSLTDLQNTQLYTRQDLEGGVTVYEQIADTNIVYTMREVHTIPALMAQQYQVGETNSQQ